MAHWRPLLSARPGLSTGWQSNVLYGSTADGSVDQLLLSRDSTGNLKAAIVKRVTAVCDPAPIKNATKNSGESRPQARLLHTPGARQALNSCAPHPAPHVLDDAGSIASTGGTDLTPGPDGALHRLCSRDTAMTWTGTRFNVDATGAPTTAEYTNRMLGPGYLQNDFRNDGELAALALAGTRTWAACRRLRWASAALPHVPRRHFQARFAQTSESSV